MTWWTTRGWVAYAECPRKAQQQSRKGLMEEMRFKLCLKGTVMTSFLGSRACYYILIHRVATFQHCVMYRELTHLGGR